MSSNVVAINSTGRSVAAARRRADKIRATLEVAVDLIIDAWRDGDAETLGYGPGMAGWKTYVEHELHGIQLTLPVGPRRERLLAMREAGMSTRAIQLTPGAGSAGTVNGDLKALRAAGLLDDDGGTVTSLDGRRHAAQRTASPAVEVLEGEVVSDVITVAAERQPVTPAGGLTAVDLVVAAIAAAGPAGMTCLELVGHLGWRQGPTSCALSRAQKRHRVMHAGQYRDGFGAYVVPQPQLT